MFSKILAGQWFEKPVQLLHKWGEGKCGGVSGD